MLSHAGAVLVQRQIKGKELGARLDHHIKLEWSGVKNGVVSAFVVWPLPPSSKHAQMCPCWAFAYIIHIVTGEQKKVTCNTL